jgi:hypothetical protein
MSWTKLEGQALGSPGAAAIVGWLVRWLVTYASRTLPRATCCSLTNSVLISAKQKGGSRCATAANFAFPTVEGRGTDDGDISRRMVVGSLD